MHANEKNSKKSAQMFNYKVVQIPTEQICPNKQQPRQHFDTNQMIRLADSIRRYGIVQPLTVRLATPTDSNNANTSLPSSEKTGYKETISDDRIKIYNKSTFVRDYIESQTESASARTDIYTATSTKNPLYITHDIASESPQAQRVATAYSSSKEFFELVSGERRLRAAKILGISTVPCIILEANDNESAEIAIIENLQRENLNVFEQGEAYRNLIRRFGFTQEEIASKMGISQSSVANKIRLLALLDDERELLLENQLTERHARALLRIKEADVRREALSHIISHKLNVEESEKYIDRLCEPYETARKSAKCQERAPEAAYGSLYKLINRAVMTAKSSGLQISSLQEENDNEITIRISIPKHASNL